MFIAFVHKNSPASMAGLRFGDQILQINNENVAGWDMDKCMKVLKKAAPERITMAIRDRCVKMLRKAVSWIDLPLCFVFSMTDRVCVHAGRLSGH